MRFSDLFTLSIRMFKARTSRTFLTILGMGVGIGAILFLVSLGYGLQNTLLEKITTSDSLLTLDVVEDKAQEISLNEAALQKIKDINGVAEISPVFNLDSRGNLDELSSDLPATVMDPDYLKLGGTKLSLGARLNEENVEGIVVSSAVVKIFNLEPDEIIGKEMILSFSSPADQKIYFENGSSYENSFEIIGIIESDESFVYVNSAALDSVKPESFSQVKVKCRDNELMASVQEKITAEGFSVSSLSETVDQANKVFAAIKLILMLFGIIALVVSAIGMFNTMTITLLERTEEIGIMKSIGASDKMISLMFVMEATIMGFLGGLAGIIIGVLEGEIFNLAINLVASYFGGEKVDLFYSPLWFVVSIIIFSAFVGFLTGVIPARRASQIDPLEALRYK